MKGVREDKMPLDENLKISRLESAGAFEALVEAAKAWERKR
jgi:hypothetical protein